MGPAVPSRFSGAYRKLEGQAVHEECYAKYSAPGAWEGLEVTVQGTTCLVKSMKSGGHETYAPSQRSPSREAYLRKEPLNFRESAANMVAELSDRRRICFEPQMKRTTQTLPDDPQHNCPLPSVHPGY